MNNLLKRQIKKYLGESNSLDKNFISFLNAVSNAYDGFEEDRKLIERSMDISSKELKEINEQLKQEYSKQSFVINKLREAVRSLSKNTIDTSNSVSVGDIDYLANVLSNLIEEKNVTEQALIEAKDKAELISKVVPNAIFTVDIEKRITSWNKKAEEITGYSLEEALGKKCTFLCADSCNDVCRLFDNNFQKPLMTREAAIQKKDGITLTILKNADLLKNHEGKVIGGIESFEDITERKKIEAQIIESEGKYRSLVDNTNLAIIYTDKGSVIQLANRKSCSLIGIEQDKLIGKKFFDVFLKQQSEEIIKKCQEILESKKDCEFEDIAAFNGKKMWFLFNVQFLKDADGQYLGTQIIANDITEKKEAEFELENYKKHLEDLIVERTGELNKAKEKAEKAAADIAEAHMHLKQAKIEAESANEAKSRFLANISHEIRTPLNCIIGFAEMISEVDQSIPQIKKRASDILSESLILLALINTLLDHAKIEAGKLQLELLPFYIYKLLNDIEKSFEIKLKSKNLKFYFKIESDFPKIIIGDSFRLRQILANLIDNAIKFTNKGSVTVDINKIHEDQNEIVIKFNVIDTGIGISKERQAAIFESFTQEDDSTTREYGGTGLGTTISQELVKLMGGEIGVESEINKGSTFWFTIKVKKFDNKELNYNLNKTNNADFKLNNEIKGKILLVEDYIPNQEVAKMHLQYAGHDVKVVDDGLKAIEICKLENFDMILMDVQMPKMSGYEAAVKIRKISGYYADVPILALTANADGESRIKCKNSRMDEIITKPIRRNNFLSVVNSYLSNKNFQKIYNQEEQKENKTVNECPLNYEEALNEFAGNRMLLDNSLSHFVVSLESLITLMDEALQKNDYETLRRESHKIRGAAANLTAMDLSKVAEQIENSSVEKKHDFIAGLLIKFKKESQRLISFIKNGYKKI